MYEVGMITRPETEWQNVDAMWEADAAAEWERLNEEDANLEKCKQAEKTIEKVLDFIDSAKDYLIAAEEDADGLPITDRMASIENDLDNLWCDLNAIKKRLKKGDY